MNIQELKRKDMDEMVVETVMRTRFRPIQEKMVFVTELLINNEIIETQEYAVPDNLEDKNRYFHTISDGLQEGVAVKLRDIYSRV